MKKFGEICEALFHHITNIQQQKNGHTKITVTYKLKS